MTMQAYTYSVSTDADHVANAKTAHGARLRAKTEARRLKKTVTAWETSVATGATRAIAVFAADGAEQDLG